MTTAVTDSRHLSRLVIHGFKSIADCDLELSQLNVLIGANGAGKSNFIGFFKMINQMLEGDLQRYVSYQGGPDALLHYGRKTTERLKAELYFGDNGYLFELEPTVDNRMMYAQESFYWKTTGVVGLGRGHFETLADQGSKTRVDRHMLSAIKSWRVYHFHDTSDTAKVKQLHAINDNAYLRPDASNLAAYLYLLQQTQSDYYKLIIRTIKLVAPFFGDFFLRPQPNNREKIELEWTESGQDVPFKAHHLSDGTLRFICLATLLLQPAENMPATILIDEPELGLHPYAITVLGSLLRAAAEQHQIIVSTQSVELVNEFDADDLIVVEREGGRSTFKRLDETDLQDWLQDYSLGELWKKNLIGGRPAR